MRDNVPVVGPFHHLPGDCQKNRLDHGARHGPNERLHSGDGFNMGVFLRSAGRFSRPVDVLLPFMGAKTRWLADSLALASIVFLIGVTSWKTWVIVLKSYDIGAVINTYPLTPLWVPHTVVAIGFSMLALTAIHMMLDMIAEALRPVLHKMQGGTESSCSLL